MVPFVKVDKGLAAEKDGVSLMKPMPDVEQLLARAVKRGVFGTKMRSFINLASQEGIAAVVKQQFDIADQIAKHGLMPIIEPEVSIKSQDKAGAEAILLAEITKRLDALPEGRKVMLKLTIPEHARPLCAAHRARAGSPRGRALRRLYAGRGLRTPGRESWHDRKLLARARTGSQAFDERRGVRQGARRFDRRNLSGLDRQGLTRNPGRETRPDAVAGHGAWPARRGVTTVTALDPMQVDSI